MAYKIHPIDGNERQLDKLFSEIRMHKDDIISEIDRFCGRIVAGQMVEGSDGCHAISIDTPHNGTTTYSIDIYGQTFDLIFDPTPPPGCFAIFAPLGR
jgi:hypothetical protein